MVTALEWLLTAKDEASQAFEKVAKATEKAEGNSKKVAAALSIAAGVVTGALATMAVKSVEAAQKGETAQAALEQAYKHFPKLADENISKLRELNDALEAKVGADHNDLATAQSKLAMFDLTGKQIAQLTPLLVDYAQKTGQTLPDAATGLGRALEGNARALKAVGIEMPKGARGAKAFAAIMDGLKAKVGGFAEGEANTAAGKTRILSREFDALQETIGKGLLPVISAVMGAVTPVVEWLNKNPAQLKAVEIGVIALATALGIAAAVAWVMNAAIVAQTIALLADPIIWIVVGIGLLIAALVLLVTHWSEVTAFISDIWNKAVVFVQQVWQNFTEWLMSIVNNLVRWWNEVWTAFGRGVQIIWNDGIVKPITDAVNFIWTNLQRGFAVIGNGWNNFWRALGVVVRGAFNDALSFIQGGINGAIDLINGALGAVNTVGGAVGIHVGLIPHVSLPHFADGGWSAGGLAIVGERGPEVLNLPAGTHVNSNGSTSKVSLDDDTVRRVARALAEAIVPGVQYHAVNAAGAVLDAALLA